MRLVKLSVQRFQCIQSAEVEFGPHLNVLYGPNDVGKSSLAWAIRAVLLLQHSSSHAARFSSWHDDGEPRVALTFTDDSERFWRVTKVFGGSSGRSTLESSKDGRSWTAEASAREVDKRVRELLRWGLPAPGGQGRGSVPESFLTQVLLADQSQDSVRKVLFESRLGEDADESGRQRLTEALGALAQDPVFKRVLDEATTQVDQAFTPKGRRKMAAGSPWVEVKERIKDLTSQQDQLDAKVKESAAVEERIRILHEQRRTAAAALDAASEEHAAATKEVEAGRTRDALLAQVGAHEQKVRGVEALTKRIAGLDAEIEQLTTQVEREQQVAACAAEEAIAATTAVDTLRRELDGAVHESPDVERQLALLQDGVVAAEESERNAVARVNETTAALRAAKQAAAEVGNADAQVARAAEAVRVAETTASLAERERVRATEALEEGRQRQRDARSSDRAQTRELRRREIENRRLTLDTRASQLEDMMQRAQQARELSTASVAADKAVQATARTLAAARAETQGLDASITKLNRDRLEIAPLEVYGHYRQLRDELARASQRAAESDRDRARSAELRARVEILRADHRENLPDGQQLAALRALREELRIAEAALGGGLSLTLRPKRPLEIRASRDEVATPPAKVSEPTAFAAQRTLAIEITDVLELEVSAGEDAARRKAADLRARWLREGEAALVEHGASSLEELEGARRRADDVARDIATQQRDAEACEQRLAAAEPVDVAGLCAKVERTEAELGGADREDLALRFARLGDAWQASLRTRSSDLETELDAKRRHLEQHAASVARLEVQLEAQESEVRRLRDDVARAEQALGQPWAATVASAKAEREDVRTGLTEIENQLAKLASGASEEESAADADVARAEAIVERTTRASEQAQNALRSSQMAHVQATTHLDHARTTARQLDTTGAWAVVLDEPGAALAFSQWENSCREAEDALKSARATLASCRALLAEARRSREESINALRQKVQAAESIERAARASREAADTTVKQTLARRAAANTELADFRVQVASVNVEDTRREIAALRERVRALEPELGPHTKEDLATIERNLERLRNEVHELDEEIARARGALEQVGGAIVRERLAEIRQAIVQTLAREHEIEVDCEAWKLLHDTLRATESTESAHLGRVLAGPVSTRFRELTEGRYGDLELGAHLEAGGIHVAGEVREIGALSAGTQDQLATLLRICIAEQLESAIVLDDHLSQSDSERISWFNAMLRAASEKVQIVLITCRPQEVLAATEMAASGVAHLTTGPVTAVDLSKIIHRYSQTVRAVPSPEPPRSRARVPDAL